MSKKRLKNSLQQMPNALRIHRDRIAKEVMDSKNGLKHLIAIAFELPEKTAIKAAWILEIIACKKQVLYIPYLSFYCHNIQNITHESAKRPFAKITSILTLEARKGNQITFSSKQEELLTALHFDWLTTESSIAVKVHSMETLYQLGFGTTWIHPALKLLLLQHLSSESPAYRARGKKILRQLNRLT
ncbi:MAG: hypothetical protein JKY08_09020 [Flavobacteriaceae bacterium]|nr:hypothetical protein [Flavobacteriaceae bacterium]